MKSLILAAGQGTRMGKYCAGRPKGMLPFLGKPLLAWQIESLRRAGLSDISIVTGYAAETIVFPEARLFHNPDFASTNMIASLLTAKVQFGSDILVSYADILFQSDLAHGIGAVEADVVVAADREWKQLWEFRYGAIDQDLESFKIEADRVTELGRPCTDPAEQQLRYIGLIKFSARALARAVAHVAQKQSSGEPWRPSGKPFALGYMTDLLFELIETGLDVKVFPTTHGWIEFDTEADYEKLCALAEQNRLAQFIELHK